MRLPLPGGGWTRLSGMNVSPHDYDREERKNSSWWSSRHASGIGGVGTLKRVRRLTLIDLLLLLVMLGVLIPWILQMEDTVDAGPYRIRIDERRRSGEFVLVLKITLPRGSGGTDDNAVGWMIFDDEGTLLHEERDLPPAPGKSREFVYLVSPDRSVSCEIIAGIDKVVILTGED